MNSDILYLYFSNAETAAAAHAKLLQADFDPFKPIIGARANHNPEYLELMVDYFDSGAVSRMAHSLNLTFEVVDRGRVVWPSVHPLKRMGAAA